MPTYDYECKKCGNFEYFQSMKDDPFTECPNCGSKAIKRLIGTGAGIIFKGSGFYETDYRSDSYNAGAKKAKEAKESSSSSSKSDSSGGSGSSGGKSESKSKSSKASKTSKKGDS